jgi:hypothetical protein
MVKGFARPLCFDLCLIGLGLDGGMAPRIKPQRRSLVGYFSLALARTPKESDRRQRPFLGLHFQD